MKFYIKRNRFSGEWREKYMVYRRTDIGQKRYHNRRKMIISAARTLFADQGYDETTMQQVVLEAGTSIGNCYFYFQNKESLLLTVIEEIISEIWSPVDIDLDQEPSGIKKLAILLYRSITLMLDHEEWGRLMLKALSLPAVRNSVLDNYRKRVRKLAKENPESFKGEDVDLKINAAHGAGIALLEMKLNGELFENSSEIGLFLVRYNLQGLGFPQDAIEQAMSHLIKSSKKKEGRSGGRSTINGEKQ